MAYNENFLFFNEGTDAANATGDGAMYKSSDFIGANVVGAATVDIHFKARRGDATDDSVRVVQNTADIPKLMQELASVLSNPKGGFFVQSDFVTENGPHPIFTDISGIAIQSAN